MTDSLPATLLTIFTLGFSALLLLASLGALLRLPHGAIRSLDFPRLQILVLALLMMPLAEWALAPGWRLAVVLGLALAAVIQIVQVIRFTPLWHRQSFRPQAPRPEAQITLMASNVKQSNRAYDRLLTAVRREMPDILMVVETDQDWLDALSPLHALYPHRIEQPHDNGYGMAMLSKRPLEAPEIREVLVEKVPSIRAGLRMEDGQAFRLYLVHPEPPVPYQDTEGRDAEIGLIGLEAAKDPLPAVVTGDLNDVAWSYTTRRFQRLSGLLDPRVGRGFFNSFDARWPLLRWPLDHLFHDPRFRLVEMRRLEAIGSDHFPMLFRLQLEPAEGGATPEDPSREDRTEIREMAQAEARRDREAVGSDWEDED